MKTDEQNQVFNKLMILCWAAFLAILWATGRTPQQESQPYLQRAGFSGAEEEKARRAGRFDVVCADPNTPN